MCFLLILTPDNQRRSRKMKIISEAAYLHEMHTLRDVLRLYRKQTVSETCYVFALLLFVLMLSCLGGLRR